MEREVPQLNQQQDQILIAEQKRRMNKRTTIALLALAAVVFVAVGGILLLKAIQPDVLFRLEIKETRFDSVSVVQRYELRQSGILFAEGEEAGFEKQLSAEQAQSFLAAVRDSQIMQKECKGKSDPAVVPRGWYREYVLHFEGETKTIAYGGDFSKNTCADELQETLNLLSSDAKSEEEVDISTWQTYRNDEFGFELEYPAYLGEIKPYTFSDKVLTSDESRRSETDIRNLGIIVVTDEVSLEAYLEELDSRFVCYDEFDRNCFDPTEVLKESNIRVGAHHAVQREVAEYALPSTAPTNYNIETLIDLTPRMIVYVDVAGQDRGITESMRQLNNQILSTFRFIDESGVQLFSRS